MNEVSCTTTPDTPIHLEPGTVDTTAGPAIRMVRETLGLTQRQLAELAGISHSYLSRVESGRRLPTWRWTRRVTRTFCDVIRGV